MSIAVDSSPVARSHADRDVLFDVQTLVDWLKADLIGDPDLPISAVVIDSRRIKGHSLFVALPGRHTHGYDYLADVLSDGNNVALVEERYASRELGRLRQLVNVGGAICIVPDARRALLQLAQRQVERFPEITRVAITGSVGKTATKEFVAAILSQKAPTFMTRQNFNSDIGLPLETFRIDADQRYAVFEAGMNRPGEIADLADVIRPDLALITNIGRAHIGELGELSDSSETAVEAIGREKAALFSRLDGNQLAFVHEDEPLRDLLIRDIHGKVIWYGERSTPGFEGFESQGLAGNRLYWRGQSITIRLPGEWHLRNVLGAISIACELSCSDEQIATGLSSVGPLFGRGEVIEGEITVIQDCYNASPESTDAALAFLGRLEWPGRKICVLGALKELGAWSAGVHQEVLENACHVDAAALFLVGEEYGQAYEAMQSGSDMAGCAHRTHYYRDYSRMRAALLSFVQSGDVVLLKGSRSIGLERLTPDIMALHRTSAEGRLCS